MEKYSKINVNGLVFTIPTFVLQAILNRAGDIEETTGISMKKIAEIELLKWRNESRKNKIGDIINGDSKQKN